MENQWPAFCVDGYCGSGEFPQESFPNTDVICTSPLVKNQPCLDQCGNIIPSCGGCCEGGCSCG